MRVRFHSTKETWKLRFPTQSDTFCVTTSGLLLSTSSFLFRDNEFTASSWNNWQSWKKFSFVSSAFYTPPVRRPGVPRLAATKSRKRECTPANTKIIHLQSRCCSSSETQGQLVGSIKCLRWKFTARLDLTVNFHHEHFIDPINCPWVSEDGCRSDNVIYVHLRLLLSYILLT